MKRTLSVFALAALLLSVGAIASALRSSHLTLLGPGTALADTAAVEKAEEKKENPAEEKKETPAQERAEEKSEGKAHHAVHKTMPMVDINSASKEDLMKVSGITDEIAEKIMAARPFTSRSQLLSKKILTADEYRKIKTKVMVKKPKAAAKS